MLETRPFGQSDTYSQGGRLAIGPLYSGRAYKFRLLVPVDAEGVERFSDLEILLLEELFYEDFGGSTRSSGTVAPTVAGSYWSSAGTKMQDGHISFDVYTLQTPNAIAYFRELSTNLARYSRDVLVPRIAATRPADEYGGEEKVLVELTETLLL